MPQSYAYFQKQFVPLSEAKIGVMTHAFNYGTGVFEGIRGNWDVYVINADGSGLKNLSNHPAYDFFEAWSPDETRLAFVSEGDG